MFSSFLFPLIATIFSWLFFSVLMKLFFSLRLKLSWCLLSIIQKNKNRIAEEIAIYIREQFAETDLLNNQLKDSSAFKAIKPDVENHVDHFIKEKLVKKWPVISILGGDEVIEKIKQNLMEELEMIIPMLLQKYSTNFKDKFPIEDLVKERLQNISSLEIHRMIFKKSKTIRRVIPLVAALNGFIIGVIFLLF